jgi:ParB-like chromosome segregation protein Spo0J
VPSNWKQTERALAELHHLTDEALTERLGTLRADISKCLERGTGRNPRAARDFRRQAEAVEREIERREQR